MKTGKGALQQSNCHSDAATGGGVILFWVRTAADNSLKYALRYSVHRSSAPRSTPLGCLKSQDARLVFNQESHSAEAQFQ